MRKFKTKKTKNNFIWYIGIFLISVAFSINYLFREKLINDDTIIKILISDFNNKDVKVNNIEFLLRYGLNINLLDSNLAFNEEDTNKNKEEINIKDQEDKPIVYIYNTHQTEEYKSDYLENYNISSNVLLASKILKEYLSDLGITAIVEEDNVADKLHSLNWKYGSSYKVSRMFMESAYEENPSLMYFIDLHRDSSKYEKTTTEINGESYAKLLFVVGLDHDNYEPNLEFAQSLSAILKKYDENLYRGIMKKSGKGVNGIYNQDFNENTILIEVGGQYNNISEVNNTLKVLASTLSEYIKEDMNEKEET